MGLNWCRVYRERADIYREKWWNACARVGRLEARLQIAEQKIRQLEEQAKQDQEELDRWMDTLEEQILTPNVLEAIQNA